MRRRPSLSLLIHNLCGREEKLGMMTHQSILVFPACWAQASVNALIKNLTSRKTPIETIKKIKSTMSGNNNIITAAGKSITDWQRVFFQFKQDSKNKRGRTSKYVRFVSLH